MRVHSILLSAAACCVFWLPLPSRVLAADITPQVHVHEPGGASQGLLDHFINALTSAIREAGTHPKVHILETGQNILDMHREWMDIALLSVGAQTRAMTLADLMPHYPALQKPVTLNAHASLQEVADWLREAGVNFMAPASLYTPESADAHPPAPNMSTVVRLQVADLPLAVVIDEYFACIGYAVSVRSTGTGPDRKILVTLSSVRESGDVHAWRHLPGSRLPLPAPRAPRAAPPPDLNAQAPGGGDNPRAADLF